MMNIQETQQAYEEWLQANPDFDEELLGKSDEDDECSEYLDDETNSMYSAFEAGATAQEHISLNEIRAKQREINELKAKLEKLEKSKSGIVLTCSQLLEAFQFGAPDGESDEDQMATEMAIKWFNDGHSGAGYYCYYSDYPEEGAIFLGEEAAQGEEE